MEYGVSHKRYSVEGGSSCAGGHSREAGDDTEGLPAALLAVGCQQQAPPILLWILLSKPV